MNSKKLLYSFLAIVILTCFGTIGFAEGLQFDHVMNIGSMGSGNAQFKYVEDFAFDKKGNLLATDAANSNIQVFNKTTGDYISQFGGKGDEDDNFIKPEGIAVSPEGFIFVADYTTGYIKKFDENYQWLTTFSNYGEAPGENIKSEFMDIYEGLLYMAEAGNHRVDVFDMEGNFKFLFGGKGSEPGQMNNPEAAKVNSEGAVYVADLKNDRMQVFSKDGKFLKTWGKTGTAAGEFKAPSGVAIDKDDNVYVCEIGNDRVQVFDKDGNFITMWGKKGSGNGEFGNLHGIIVDDSTGWVYVADTENCRIQVFKPSKK
jgi:DNA-binding beta-propeller fold protein YncE